MRLRYQGTLLVPLLLITSCSGPGDAPSERRAEGPPDQAEGPPSGGYTVEAKDVILVPAAAGGHTLSGNFSLREARPGDRSIPTASLGGACLLAQMPGPEKSCTEDTDCTITPSSGPSWRGYCLPKSERSGNSAKTCWARPADAACQTRVPLGDHRLPDVDMAAAYQYAAANGPPNAPLRWMVYGCLNGEQSSGCATGQGVYMHDQGPTKQLR